MKLEIKKKSEKTFSIYVDDEPWKVIHTSIFGIIPKFPLEFASWEDLNIFFEDKQYKGAKNFALRRLAMQSYYSKNLEKLLKERLVPKEIISKVIEECQSYGFINDEAWLEAFMRSHAKKHSMRAISMKLHAKGIPNEIIEDLMGKWSNQDDEKSKIKNLLETRYKKNNLKDYKEKQKVISSLVRKGYSFDSIYAVLGSLHN